MPAKKKPTKARKPKPFRLATDDLAECREYPAGRMLFVDIRAHLNGSKSRRFAAWMAMAAAWCSEDPKSPKRVTRRAERRKDRQESRDV